MIGFPGRGSNFFTGLILSNEFSVPPYHEIFLKSIYNVELSPGDTFENRLISIPQMLLIFCF